jgi:hypothetical protein
MNLSIAPGPSTTCAPDRGFFSPSSQREGQRWRLRRLRALSPGSIRLQKERMFFILEIEIFYFITTTETDQISCFRNL